jgi:hypothetical protein
MERTTWKPLDLAPLRGVPTKWMMTGWRDGRPSSGRVVERADQMDLRPAARQECEPRCTRVSNASAAGRSESLVRNGSSICGVDNLRIHGTRHTQVTPLAFGVTSCAGSTRLVRSAERYSVPKKMNSTKLVNRWPWSLRGGLRVAIKRSRGLSSLVGCSWGRCTSVFQAASVQMVEQGKRNRFTVLPAPEHPETGSSAQKDYPVMRALNTAGENPFGRSPGNRSAADAAVTTAS